MVLSDSESINMPENLDFVELNQQGGNGDDLIDSIQMPENIEIIDLNQKGGSSNNDELYYKKKYLKYKKKYLDLLKNME